MRLVVAAVLISACGGPARLYPAGSDKDDGHGVLARASARFIRHPGATEDDAFASSRDRVDAYGGAAYGGAGYATYVVPTWQTPPGGRAPTHTQIPDTAGAIEGVVRWRGARPRPDRCGATDLGSDGGIAGVVVYIEHVQIGRVIGDRTDAVGGIVVKRGCAFEPRAQIVTPLPAGIAIHGDARPVGLEVIAPNAPARAYDLEEGGLVTVQAQPGVTRIAARDGSLAPAWVVALDTPYYAITDDAGRFRIDELAAGTYEVTFWRAPSSGTTPVITRRTVRVDGKPAGSRLDVTFAR